MEKKHRLHLPVLLFPLLLLACGGCGTEKKASAPASTDHKASEFISAVAPASGKFHATDKITLTVTPAHGVEPDSVAFYICGQRISATGNTTTFTTTDTTPLGKCSWHATAYIGADSSARYGNFTLLAKDEPAKYGYKIKRKYPHNTASYTQGLLWHDGFIYESTGMEGHSSLMKVDLQSGRAVQTRQLDSKYFGEGLALLDGIFYQLTWQNNIAFTYTLEDMKPIRQFSYPDEGWGLTTDGQVLYMSDGTNRIHVIDPKNFTRIRTIQVFTDRDQLQYINEMEWVDGELWANIYTTSLIARIDPVTGCVKGIIDLTGILPQQEVTQSTDVMNGIAYDPQTGRIFVTGKYWSKLFEIEITN